MATSLGGGFVAVPVSRDAYVATTPRRRMRIAHTYIAAVAAITVTCQFVVSGGGFTRTLASVSRPGFTRTLPNRRSQ